MAYTIESIRKELDVSVTERDRGLIMTLKVVAYDNGMITVNERVINSPGSDPATAWLGANEVIGGHLSAFRRKVRRAQCGRVMSEGEVYLGDGLFASWDGYQIRLRAPRSGGDDEVFLEAETLAAFLEFVKALPIRTT